MNSQHRHRDSAREANKKNIFSLLTFALHGPQHCVYCTYTTHIRIRVCDRETNGTTYCMHTFFNDSHRVFFYVVSRRRRSSLSLFCANAAVCVLCVHITHSRATRIFIFLTVRTTWAHTHTLHIHSSSAMAFIYEWKFSVFCRSQNGAVATAVATATVVSDRE